MKATKTTVAAAATPFVPYSKKQVLKPETLKLFLDYAEDAPNWGNCPLVNGNVGNGLGDVGRLSHMKMAGLLVTEKTNDRINNRIAHLSWIRFTKAGVALAAEHGITIGDNIFDEIDGRIAKLKANKIAIAVEVIAPKQEIPEPVLPPLSMETILQRAQIVQDHADAVEAAAAKAPRKPRAKKSESTLDIKAIATSIVNKYYNDLEFMQIVDDSSEMYRAMHSESGLANMIVDGSPEYVALVDEMEAQMTSAATVETA